MCLKFSNVKFLSCRKFSLLFLTPVAAGVLGFLKTFCGIELLTYLSCTVDVLFCCVASCFRIKPTSAFKSFFPQLSLSNVMRKSYENNSAFQAKMKRRIILGLREVTKHLKLRKLKCVVISPNLERIQSKGE